MTSHNLGWGRKKRLEPNKFPPSQLSPLFCNNLPSLISSLLTLRLEMKNIHLLCAKSKKFLTRVFPSREHDHQDKKVQKYPNDRNRAVDIAQIQMAKHKYMYILYYIKDEIEAHEP